MFRLASLAFAALVLVACSGADVLNLTSILDGRVEKGVSYGKLERQKLDIYRPDGAPKATVMFVYGGSWQEGERGDYAFVAEALANAGFTTVIPDYRLYPDVKFPDFVNDAAAAFAAVRKSSDGPVFVMGHSAGGQIAALLSLDPRYLARHDLSPCRDIAGLIGVSGPYDFLPLEDPEFFPIFPEATRDEIAPINFVGGKHPPSLLLHSRDDEVVDAEEHRQSFPGFAGYGQPREESRFRRCQPRGNHWCDGTGVAEQGTDLRRNRPLHDRASRQARQHLFLRP